MSQRTIAELRALFEAGDQPTQQNFYDIFDSFIHATQSSLFGLNVKGDGYNAVGDGIEDDSGAFLQADVDLTDAGGGDAFVPPGNYKIAVNVTMDPLNRVVFAQGAKLTLASGVTFTFGAQPVLPLAQVFVGPGVVEFTKAPEPYRPEWWGAAGESAATDYAAWQAMYAAMLSTNGGRVGLSPASLYLLATQNAIPEAMDNLEVVGYRSSLIRCMGANNASIFWRTYASQAEQFVFRGFSVDGNHSLVAANGEPLVDNNELFRIGQVKKILVEDLTIYNTPTVALYIGAGGSGFDSESIKIKNNDLSNIGVDIEDPDNPGTYFTSGAGIEAISVPPNSQECIDIEISSNVVHGDTGRVAASNAGCTAYSVEANSGGHGRNVRVVNNTARDLVGNGAKLGPGLRGFVLANNTFENVGQVASSNSGAIICHGTGSNYNEDGIIANNIARACDQQALSIKDSKRVLAHYNEFYTVGETFAVTFRDNSEDVTLEHNKLFIANPDVSANAAAMIMGAGTGTQTRLRVRFNEIVCMTQLAPTNGLVNITSNCVSPEFNHNTFDNQSFTTFEAVKINNSVTGVVMLDNRIKGALTYSFGNQAMIFREVSEAGNFYFGKAAKGTTDTAGFLTIPSCAGTPTGTPSPALRTGQVALQLDTSTGRLYYYYGGAWHYIAQTA